MIDEQIARIRAFNRFYTPIIGLLDKQYLDSEFSLTEVRIMFELHHHPDGMTASDLIDLLNLDKGYLSRLLQILEKRKLILKKKSEQDGRVFHLHLSEKGAEVFTGLSNASQARVKNMLSNFTEADIVALTGHMDAIRNIFENRPTNKMNGNINLNDVIIRTDLHPGDIGYVTWMHGALYGKEYNFSTNFEAYVAAGLYEFHKYYDPDMDRVWVAEHSGRMVGFLLLMHRKNNAAQLRFFILEPEYRGIGLGKKLTILFSDFLKDKGYKTCFLWTTEEQTTAAAIYKKMGFVLTDEVESTTFGKKLKELRYEMIVA